MNSVILKNLKCPQCGKAAQFEFRPFCSERCRNIDLHHWFSGNYVIEGEVAEVKKDENLDHQ